MAAKTLCSLAATPFLILGMIALAQPPADPASSRPHPVLVELFTSEGCSSCPPADALMGELNGKVTPTGQLIVGISEHVTYWNQLGWADPFSAPAYTQRQSAYAARFGLDSVYTPQVVVNGARQVLGGDSGAILRAVRETDQLRSMVLHIDEARISAGELIVSYSATGSTPPKSVDIFAVLAEDSTTSHVLRGENSGRTLAHVSVARGIFRLSPASGGDRQNTVHLSLGTLAPTSAARHVILFAQMPRSGAVLAIDAVPLAGGDR